MDMTWFDELEAKIPKGTVRTRFAPSPTGYMHVGNLRTALYTWLIARKAGGQFIFRLEDTDQTRQVEGATELIYRTMAECGLTHDEGPDVGGPVGPYIQTQRRGLRTPAAACPSRRLRPSWPPASPMSSGRKSPIQGPPPSPTPPLGRSPWKTAPWTTRF